MTITAPKYFTIDNLKVSGIYFLLKKGKVVYIGQTTNIWGRIIGHQVSYKDFDKIRFIPCYGRRIRLKYERRWIRKFRPKFNKSNLFISNGLEKGMLCRHLRVA